MIDTLLDKDENGKWIFKETAQKTFKIRMAGVLTGNFFLSCGVPLTMGFVDWIANKKTDDAIEENEDIVNRIRDNSELIWTELQKSYCNLITPNYNILDVLSSEYITNHPEYMEHFEEDFVNKIAVFFMHNQALLEGTTITSINDLVDGLLNAPITTINSFAKDEIVFEVIKIYFDVYLNEIAKEHGLKWQIEGSENNVVLDYKPETILYTGGGDDFIYTKNKQSVILGGSGNDIIMSGIVSDELYGDSGEDTIYGGAGNDKIYGGFDDDKLYGDSGEDTINGGSGEDHIYGDEGDDTLYGDSGRDTIDGGLDNDTLFGDDDNDTLRGREGDDTLNGGANDDTLRGGDHSDTYHFYKYGGNDNIYDKYDLNTIIFDGLEPTEFTIAYTGTYQQDLIFTIASTSDTLTIIDFKNTANNFRYKFGDDSDSYTVDDNDGVLSFSKIEGNNFGVRYGSHWEKQHDDNGSSNSNRYSSATVAQSPRDPLVIDLGTSGINLSTVEAGVHFDIDKNGFAEKTVWTDGEDGFLVLDRNGNDIIDDGGELFSDHVIMSDGRTSSDGFEALADLDEDGNGIIDANDSRFTDLRVWIDSERDGFSAADELKTLEDLGITSIVLPENQSDPDDDTVEFIKTGSVIFEDGIRDIQEHWFEINGADTQEITVNNVEIGRAHV